MSLRKQLINGGISVTLIKIIGTIVAFSLSIVLARILGADGFGAYSYALSLLMLLTIPIQAGFPTLAVRETSKALTHKNWNIIGGIWLWVFRSSFIYFIGLCLLLGLIALISLVFPTTIDYKIFLSGFIIIPLSALIISQSAIIRGLGRVVLGSLFDGLIRPSVSLFIILLTFFLFPSYDITPFYAMATHVIAISVTFLASFVTLKWLTKLHIKTIKQLRYNIVSWRRTLYPLTVAGGVQLLFGYIDIVVLGFFYSDKEVGVYRVAVQFSSLVVFGLTVLNQMLHPYFARFHAEKNRIKLQQLVTVSSRVIFAFAFFPALIFIIYGEEIISFIYGEEYIAGINALKILVIGQLINAAFGSVGALLNMTGHEKDTMKGMLIALLANTFLNFLLIPFFGIEGAALSTALSLILWNIILRNYVKKRLSIESSGLIFSLKG